MSTVSALSAVSAVSDLPAWCGGRKGARMTERRLTDLGHCRERGDPPGRVELLRSRTSRGRRGE